MACVVRRWGPNERGLKRASGQEPLWDSTASMLAAAAEALETDGDVRNFWPQVNDDGLFSWER
jgi:hypothetical protein